MGDPRDHVVFIVDDDRRIREALCELLESFEMRAVAFGSAAEYMAYPKPDLPACLVLDVELPDMNGLELQSRMAQGDHLHIVFITGHGDIPASVRAMKAGAVDFLPKPFKEPELMRAIDGHSAESRCQAQESRARRAAATPGAPDAARAGGAAARHRRPAQQQAAAELGISEVTLQIHRGSIMKKMQAQSLAELVRMAGALEIPITHSRHSAR